MALFFKTWERKCCFSVLWGEMVGMVGGREGGKRGRRLMGNRNGTFSCCVRGAES